MRGISHELALKHRVAPKVFLEFLKPFSSEKGFKPPEALASEAALLRAKRGKTRSKALKGVWGKNKSFSPRGRGFGGNPEGFLPSDCVKRSFTQSRNFGGSMPSKLPRLRRSLPLFAKPERGFAEIRVRRRNGSRFREKTRTVREKAVFPRSRACSAKLPEMFPNVIPIIFHIIFYHK